MKIKALVILTLSFIAVGCGKNNMAGTYQGNNTVTMQQTQQNGGTTNYTQGSLQQVNLTLTESGSNSLTGSLTAVTGGQSVNGGFGDNSSANMAGTVEGTTYNATNVSATATTANSGGQSCRATLAGPLKGNDDGSVLNG